MIKHRMRKTDTFRRVAAFICFAVVLFAVLTLGADGPLLPVVLILLCFGSIAVITLLPCAEEQDHPKQVLALPTFSPRPPPTL